MHYFFDLDNTVTESRGKISQETFDILAKMNDLVIVSGAEYKQIRSQIGDLNCLVMAQNGNHTSFWKRFLTPFEEAQIVYHIKQYSDISDDMFENRGCQIGFSLTGHHAPVYVKKAFDPDGSKRREILNKYPLPEGIECRIGGTTTMDYFPAGLNKGFNIKKLIDLIGWKAEDCIYVGDALFPGGNDETVVGVIPTKEVKNSQETFLWLKTLGV